MPTDGKKASHSMGNKGELDKKVRPHAFLRLFLALIEFFVFKVQNWQKKKYDNTLLFGSLAFEKKIVHTQT